MHLQAAVRKRPNVGYGLPEMKADERLTRSNSALDIGQPLPHGRGSEGCWNSGAGLFFQKPLADLGGLVFQTRRRTRNARDLRCSKARQVLPASGRPPA